jgi:tetratricopeptide (TPR) repeat protein
MMRTAVAAAALLSVACAAQTMAQRVQARLEKASTLRDQRRLSEAVALYDEALALSPHDHVALRGYVETMQAAGRLSEAEARFAKAVRAAPNDAWAHEALGVTLYTAGGDAAERALDELATAARLAPEEADFQYRHGLLLLDSGRYADAVPVLSRATELEPARARNRLPYAVALARTGRREEALQQLEQVLKLSPTRDEMARAEKAARQLSDPFRGFPSAAREQFELALGALDRDAPAQAQELLEQLIEKFPELAIVHATAGLCAAKMDEIGRAIVALRRASELAPDLAEPRLYLAELYLSRARADEAQGHFEAALGRNPFLADAWLGLAKCALKAGDKASAADRYGTFLLLRPDDFDALVTRAGLLGDLDRPEAGPAWDALAATFARKPETHIGRARWYFGRAAREMAPAPRAEHRSKAREALEKALELDPENQAAAAMLAELRKLPR